MTKSRALLSGLLLLLAVRIVAMFTIPLTDPTEARYAEIARKMVETGNWITPQFDYGVPFWAKPPLNSWLSALGIELFGATAFGARIGILLASLCILWIIWRWVETLFDRQTALIAMTVTASTGLFFIAAAFVQTDMLLTLGVVACMAGFYGAIQHGRQWGWLFFLGLAVGLLAKGPIAVVLTGAPIFLWMLIRGNWRPLLSLPWLGGIAMVVLLVVPWYVAAEIATPGFLHYFLIGEHIQRFLQPGWTGDLYGSGREHAKGMIWIYWLLAALPWSPLLPALIWKLRKGLPVSPNGTDGLYLYLLLFAVVPLLFFTVSANILITYTVPGLPAASILGAILWMKSSATGEKWLKVGLAELFVVAILIAIIPLTSLVKYFPSQERLISSFPENTPLAVYGTRSFSAEFYRQGKVKSLKTLDDVRAWRSPQAGIIASKGKRDELLKTFGKELRELSTDGVRTLYVFTPET